MPLPDLTLVRGAADDYTRRGRRPEPVDVGLVVEVAVSSVREDTGPTLEQYARSLLPVYWVLNLIARRVEVYSRPVVREGLGHYDAANTYGPGQSVPLVLDGQEVAQILVEDLLDADTA